MTIKTNRLLLFPIFFFLQPVMAGEKIIPTWLEGIWKDEAGVLMKVTNVKNSIYIHSEEGYGDFGTGVFLSLQYKNESRGKFRSFYEGSLMDRTGQRHSIKSDFFFSFDVERLVFSGKGEVRLIRKGEKLVMELKVKSLQSTITLTRVNPS